MKRFFVPLAVAFLAPTCGDNDNDDRSESDRWFLPLDIAVEGTTAEVRCLALVGGGVLQAARAGFVYEAVGGDQAGVPVTVTDVRKDDDLLSCRLENLAERTGYVIRAYIDLGPRCLESDDAFFETGERRPDSEPDPDPDPDPEPGADLGWAELPRQAFDPDNCIANHYCPDLYAPNGTPMRNYTVCYNAALRTGVWSAFPLHACYRGDQGRTDSWTYDPVIPRAVQPALTSGSYKPQPGYSKGHLLASNERTVSREVNKQTFYVTNVAPQWQVNFNSGVWSTLELSCWNNICADTLYIVSGVHFDDRDRTVTDQNGDPCVVPTHFYRVLLRSKTGRTGRPVGRLSADELQCVGFWFENRAYPNAVPAAYMTSVAEIERKTGMEFFVHVPQAPKASYRASDWKF